MRHYMCVAFKISLPYYIAASIVAYRPFDNCESYSCAFQVKQTPIGNTRQLQVIGVHGRSYRELLIKVPQHCVSHRVAKNITPLSDAAEMAEMLLVTETIIWCSLIIARALVNIKFVVQTRCESICPMFRDVRWILSKVRLASKLSTLLKLLKPFANYATAIINHTASIVALARAIC